MKSNLPETPLGQRALSHTQRMVACRSVNGTSGEIGFPDEVRAMLMGIAYFAARPDHIYESDVPGTPQGRRNILALLKGNGSRTVVLTGHFDTVGVDDYGALRDVATDPAVLAERIIAQLEDSGRSPEALADIQSGTFIPGRGMLDMKSGLGAGLAVLEAFSADPDFDGNLIFLASPDEENQSAGMRAAGSLLNQVAQDHDLEYVLQINMDALQDEGDVARAQAVGTGCIGKHLVTALVVGREAHACYPLDGLNALFLASSLVREMECHPALAEGDHGDASAPPVALVQNDLRAHYDITTPARAWCAWNMITRTRTAGEVLSQCTAIFAKALDEAVALHGARVRATGAAVPDREIPIYTFKDLEEQAAASPTYEAQEQVLAAQLREREDLPMPARARLLTELAWDHAQLAGPAVVIGFGGLSYPAVPPLASRGEQALAALVARATTKVSAAHDTPIGILNWLPIVTDMSFAGQDDAEGYHAAADNNPLWGCGIEWDVDGFPRMPAINAGPWGRDYHRSLERANFNYAFTVLPELLCELVRGSLGDVQADRP
ncbi:M20/M25/M40 family metallo-hydrolase [Pseudooceanicola algae]|uniref:Protein RocB n=1 Tax=Pseudooceanicola algae TaxID=1537215 RepID=A0A418SJ32_9RHOB|nr:M20/M25/M40 family metallo-hydrolase [Pseudooceanicola algae]QPM91987.1 Protein RocB [Pseudooceanicola algae]